MSILTDLFGGSDEAPYTGQSWLQGAGAGANYSPSGYNPFNVQQFGGGMGANYEKATNQQLSGQLSPSQMGMLNQQFGQNLSSIREGGFGMPSGAEKGLEYQAANQNYLNAGMLGQQNIAQGQGAAMNYLNLGQSNSNFGNTLMNNQSQFGANFGMNKAQYAGNLDYGANQQAQQNQGIFGGLIQSAAPWAMRSAFGQQPSQDNAPSWENQQPDVTANWNFGINNPF